MLLTDWLLVEVGLLLIGLTKISFVKTGFDCLERDNRLLDYQLSWQDTKPVLEILNNLWGLGTE